MVDLSTPPSNIDYLISVVLDIHGRPEELFWYSFEEELDLLGQVAVVMRGRSMCVYALRHLLEPFREQGMQLLKSILNFGSGITKADVLVEQCSESDKLKYKSLKIGLQKSIAKILESPNLFPPGLCYHCYRCVEIVK